MANSNGRTGSGRTANQRLKDRWSACYFGSCGLALAVHLTAAQVVPPWRFALRHADGSAAFIQLVPMPTIQDFVEPEADPANVVATPIHPQLPEPETADEPETRDWDALIIDVAAPVTPPRPENSRLNVAPATSRSALRTMIPPIAWPEISNPERMADYIRERFNPILAVDGVTGIVIISLWVNERGVVERVRLNETSGAAILDEIALATFADVVTFHPARDGPRAVAVQFNLSVPFLKAW